jgi:predicted component of type VI protein secretion system
MAAIKGITVPVTAEFIGMTVRPGDTLLVRYSQRLTMSAIDEIKATIRERLPGVDVLVIQADGLAVYRPDEA